VSGRFATGAPSACSPGRDPRLARQFGWATASAIFAIAPRRTPCAHLAIREAPFFTNPDGRFSSLRRVGSTDRARRLAGRRGVLPGHRSIPTCSGRSTRSPAAICSWFGWGQAVIGSVSCVLLGLAGMPSFLETGRWIAGLGLALYAPANLLRRARAESQWSMRSSCA